MGRPGAKLPEEPVVFMKDPATTVGPFDTADTPIVERAALDARRPIGRMVSDDGVTLLRGRSR